ncbi:extracellular solute-binding protein, family 3 [Lachnospiraceae bacterium XBB1006]|nr:extracellular solute-binding protein, family 3 [Lachnospiraceae bacterium XBB1006]
MNKKSGIVIIIVMVVCILISSLAWKMHSKKTITVGVDAEYEPMCFRNDQNKLCGFEADLIKKVFEGGPYNVTLKVINWEDKFEMLDKKEIDCIWCGLTGEEGRFMSYSITKPYLINGDVCVYNIKLKTNNCDDGVLLGSNAINRFINDKGEMDNTKLYFRTMRESLRALRKGRVHRCYMDDIHACYLSKTNKQLKIKKIHSYSESFVVAFRREDYRVKSWVDKQIKRIYNSGEFVTISNKWFGDDLYPKK